MGLINLTISLLIPIYGLNIPGPPPKPEPPRQEECNVNWLVTEYGTGLDHGYLVCESYFAGHRWLQTGDCRIICPDHPYKEDVA